MRNLDTIQDKLIDYDILHAELKAQFGDSFTGISTGGAGSTRLIIHLEDGTDEEFDANALGIVQDHDVTKHPPKVPKKTTEDEIAELKARIAALEGKK